MQEGMVAISSFEHDTLQSLSDEMKSLTRKMDDLLGEIKKRDAQPQMEDADVDVLTQLHQKGW